ncbi:hypothetical protein VC279_06310 [Xanthomonas sp. WHRI 10064A]|uniref:hypothetical protein n=1 Tax=unclassified Xanthomonas TaxID=2643310 RepID=UPI002B221B10|nr:MULTISPECIES: hypothetical protein [unclassified Xanthomonas]MEA9585925.1 hypothetical protein [Xanthomonas sp. WHRI 10064B]MEA9614352.1 hypothetical protein [Xanthomonas sp. WHRI 10064A]
MKAPRPTSITVIAWLLIVSSVLSVIAFVMAHGNAAAESIMRQGVLPLWIQYAIGYFGMAVQFFCALAFFKGKSWGRTLYIGWGVLGLVIGFATSPTKLALIPGMILFAVVVFFLLRPAANAFFAKGRGDVSFGRA